MNRVAVDNQNGERFRIGRRKAFVLAADCSRGSLTIRARGFRFKHSEIPTNLPLFIFERLIGRKSFVLGYMQQLIHQNLNCSREGFDFDRGLEHVATEFLKVRNGTRSQVVVFEDSQEDLEKQDCFFLLVL